MDLWKKTPFENGQALKTELKDVIPAMGLVDCPGTDGLKFINVQNRRIFLGPGIGTPLLHQQFLGRKPQGVKELTGTEHQGL